MFPNLLKSNLVPNQHKLYSNNIRLVSETVSVTLQNGTPESVVTQTTHWQGLGSIQYVRPRIQKAFGDENGGTIEDPISMIVYVPYEAMPNEGMVMVDVDGALGVPGQSYRQSRRPANVGGLSVYWEMYLGLPSNV